jgi:hypothetical protein
MGKRAKQTIRQGWWETWRGINILLQEAILAALLWLLLLGFTWLLHVTNVLVGARAEVWEELHFWIMTGAFVYCAIRGLYRIVRG